MPKEMVAGRRPPVLLAILLTVIAPVVAYASVRSNLYEATRYRVDFSKLLPPASPLPKLREAMAETRPGRRAPSPAALEIARRVAVRYPLAYEPYYLGGRVAEGRGLYPDAIRLMEEARRRRPNFLATRLQLLSYYSLTNAYQAAINEADASLRVRPESTQQLMPAFVRLVTEDQRARRAIATALARRPLWEGEFFRVAAERGMTPSAAFALVEDIQRQSRSKSVDAAHRQFLVETLVLAGEYARAQIYGLTGRNQGGRTAGLITDGAFEGKTPPPFGWRLYATADGVAERTPQRGSEPAHLVVSYFGGGPVELADQILVPKPGRYRLSSRARIDSSAEDLRLGWALNCLPGGAQLAQLPLPFRTEITTSTAAVEIPARCDAVELSLAGTPGDLPRALTAQIFDVSLHPMDGGVRR